MVLRCIISIKHGPVRLCWEGLLADAAAGNLNLATATLLLLGLLFVAIHFLIQIFFYKQIYKLQLNEGFDGLLDQL